MPHCVLKGSDASVELDRLVNQAGPAAANRGGTAAAAGRAAFRNNANGRPRITLRIGTRKPLVRRRRIGNHAPDLGGKLRRHSLVGVDREHPVARSQRRAALRWLAKSSKPRTTTTSASRWAISRVASRLAGSTTTTRSSAQLAEARQSARLCASFFATTRTERRGSGIAHRLPDRCRPRPARRSRSHRQPAPDRAGPTAPARSTDATAHRHGRPGAPASDQSSGKNRARRGVPIPGSGDPAAAAVSRSFPFELFAQERLDQEEILSRGVDDAEDQPDRPAVADKRSPGDRGVER